MAQYASLLRPTSFPLLEDEMCDLVINGVSSDASPDRLDGMVWAISAMLSDTGQGLRCCEGRHFAK